MSLDVSCALLAQAERDEIPDAAFQEVVRKSFPHAWEVVARLVAELEAGGLDYAESQTPPPDLEAQIQVLKALASDPVRLAMERSFGVKLLFQNCHRVIVFRLSAVGGESYQYFLSPRAQVLNQRPPLRLC